MKPREHAKVGLVPWNIFRLCLRAPALNNAVCIISVSQALITTARSGRSVLSFFSRVGYRFHFFFLETASP